jgi:hypothetical protein
MDLFSSAVTSVDSASAKDDVGEDEVKLVLDMAHDGPTFDALESIMRAASEAARKVKGGGGGRGGYDALTRLLKSGIPGKMAST